MFSEKLIAAIEADFKRRTGHAAFYLPSSRLGIYVTLCERFAPGQRLIVSPVTDDIVIFVILAAGLTPIFVDIDYETGGLRPDKIREAISFGANAVLTSNLYGIPDDLPAIQKVCREHNLVLIEDCAHAIGARVNQTMIGQFGEVSIFSLSKQIGGVGGIVTSHDAALVEAIRKRAKPYIRDLSMWTSLSRSFRLMGSDGLAPFKTLRRLVKSILPRDLLPNLYEGNPPSLSREGHRVPVRIEDFIGFEARLDFSRYNQHVEVDRPLYKETPCWYRLFKNWRTLKRFDKRVPFDRVPIERFTKNSGIESACPRHDTTPCYYKIPLFTKNRDQHAAALSKLGITLNHIYDPAFPYYLPPELYINCITDEKAAHRWSSDILPISPQDIEEVCAYFLKQLEPH